MPREKPNKPRAHFPLYAHASGQWAKEIRGKVHYFGQWADHQAALEEYLRQRDSDFRGGRTPSNGEDLTVRRPVDSGEIRQSTFQDYFENCERVLNVFGRGMLVSSLRPIDFEELRANFSNDRRFNRGPDRYPPRRA